MNKSDLAAAVAAELVGVEPDARQYVDAVFDTIMRQVAAGDRVQITGFGTFDSVERAARTGHNPRSREPIQVPAGVAPRFQAGQTFRTRVRESLAPSVSVAPAQAQTAAVPAGQKTVAAKPAKTKAAKKSAAEKSQKPVKAASKSGPKKSKDSKDSKTPTKKSAKPGKTGRK